MSTTLCVSWNYLISDTAAAECRIAKFKIWQAGDIHTMLVPNIKLKIQNSAGGAFSSHAAAKYKVAAIKKLTVAKSYDALLGFPSENQ